MSGVYTDFLNALAKQYKNTSFKAGDVLVSRGIFSKQGSTEVFGEYSPDFEYFYNQDRSKILVTADYETN